MDQLQGVMKQVLQSGHAEKRTRSWTSSSSFPTQLLTGYWKFWASVSSHARERLWTHHAGMKCHGVLSTCRWHRTKGEILEIEGGILYLVGLTCESVSHSVMSDSATPWTITHRLLCPRNSPGKNTGVSCCSLLQRIFPTQGSNPGLLHCRWILYCLSHRGSPY